MTTKGLNEQIIEKKLELHQKWLDRDPEGVRADFTGKNLSGLTVDEDIDLSWAIFTNANLSGADLSWTFLKYADLSGTKLRDTNLNCCTLTDVDFRYSDMRGANLQSTDLSRAILDKADASNVNLKSADLTDSSFVGAKLHDTNMTNATLSGADFTGTDLTSVDLTDAIFTDDDICNKEKIPTKEYISEPESDTELTSMWIAIDTDNVQKLGDRSVTICSHAFHNKEDAMEYLEVDNSQIVEIKVKEKPNDDLERMEAAYDIYVDLCPNVTIQTFEEFKNCTVFSQTQHYLNIVDKTGYRLNKEE